MHTLSNIFISQHTAHSEAKAEQVPHCWVYIYWSTLYSDQLWKTRSEQSPIALSGLCYDIHVQVLACLPALLEGPSHQRRALCRVITISTVLLQELDLSISLRALQETRAQCAECTSVQSWNISFTAVYPGIRHHEYSHHYCHYFGFWWCSEKRPVLPS